MDIIISELFNHILEYKKFKLTNPEKGEFYRLSIDVMLDLMDENDLKNILKYSGYNDSDPGLTVLEFMAKNSDYESIAKVIENLNKNVEDLQEEINRSLILACKFSSDLNTIKVLIEWGKGQVNSVDQDGNTPLHWVISTANCDVIRYLVYRGSNVESRNTNNETPLYWAAKNFDVVRKFDGLDSEIESWYNKLNDKGISERVYLAIVMNLINDSFANTKVINLKGETPVTLIKKGLDNSTEYSDEQKKFILESIEPLSGLNKNDLNIEILFEVCKNANLIQIDYVLDNLIPPKIQDVDGYTPLHWLIEKFSYHRNRNKSKLFKYENVVEKYLNLIENSYLIDLCTNKLKNSIFMHAVMYGNHKLVELIVKKCGRDILSQTNGIGYTALKIASVNAHDKVVSFLVEMGADINAVGSDMNGDTPLTLAVIQGNCSTIEYLSNNGADVDKPDKIGFTPVSLAIDNWAAKDKPEKIPDKNSRIYFWYEQMKHIGFTDCLMLAVGCYLVNDRKAKLEMDYLKLASQQNVEKIQRYSGSSKFEPLRNVTEMLKHKIDTERQLKNLNQTQIDFLHRFIICHNRSSEIVYRNLNKPRGFCLIVNNFDVDGKDKRFGSEHDVEKLKGLFNKLDYQVEELFDKDGYELLDNFQEFSKRKEMKGHDSLVIFIMSHGGPETIFGRDGITINIREIIEIFNNENCPYMRGKPIILFIQACRGVLKQVGVEVEIDEVGAIVPTDGPETDYILRVKSISIPHTSDLLICYATLYGHAAFRPENGALYCEALYNIFDQSHNEGDLLYLLSKVDKEVQLKTIEGKYKQTTSYENNGFNKKFFFNVLEK